MECYMHFGYHNIKWNGQLAVTWLWISTILFSVLLGWMYCCPRFPVTGWNCIHFTQRARRRVRWEVCRMKIQSVRYDDWYVYLGDSEDLLWFSLYMCACGMRDLYATCVQNYGPPQQNQIVKQAWGVKENGIKFDKCKVNQKSVDWSKKTISVI